MPTMKTVARHEFAGQIEKHLDRVLSAAESVGIELGGQDRARELRARSHDLSALRRQPEADKGARVREIATALGTGALTPDKALKEAQRVDLEADPSGAWLNVLAEAPRRAVIAAFDALRDEGEEVFEQLQPAAAAIIDEVLALRPDLPESIRDAASASKAGPDAASSWATYERLLARWAALHNLVALLRREGLVPSPTNVEGLRPPIGVGRWGDLLAREDHVREYRGPKVRSLLDAVCDAWMPGIYRAAEIEAQVKDAERRALAEKREASFA